VFGQGGKAVGAQWAILRRFVRTALESIQPPKPFQAEYEGSIPFTRSTIYISQKSSVKQCVARTLDSVKDVRALWKTSIRAHVRAQKFLQAFDCSR
jgi:hypothetical protein